MTTIKYVKPYKVPLESAPRKNSKNLTYLLWGDPVHVKDTNPPDSEWVEVMARRWDKGYLRREDLMDDPILEIYVIDVGQGDGVLFKTPDNKWHLLDAGTTNSRQMTGKGTANFVRFKFLEDLRMDKVELENIILSHPDLDHYGGIIDLLKGDLGNSLPFDTEFKHFYHNGVARFKNKPKLGTEHKDGQIGDYPFPNYRLSKKPDFLTQLLDTKPDFEAVVDELGSTFKELIEKLLEHDAEFKRLDSDMGFLPGYDESNPDLNIKILGPIVETFDGDKRGLRKLGSESKTRNGHSIVLRIDYRDVKILLTGDLNESSQKLMLNYVPKEAFMVDVAKACHHGSADILFDFLKAMQPKATVISSGDNEMYAHPQPRVVGASGFYGREFKDKKGKTVPPLVYSTELARSTNLKFPESVKTRSGFGANDYEFHHAHNTIIKAKGEFFYRKLLFVPMVSDLVYGLVSIRTDGETIIVATSKEAGNDFHVEVMTG